MTEKVQWPLDEQGLQHYKEMIQAQARADRAIAELKESEIVQWHRRVSFRWWQARSRTHARWPTVAGRRGLGEWSEEVCDG